MTISPSAIPDLADLPMFRSLPGAAQQTAAHYYAADAAPGATRAPHTPRPAAARPAVAQQRPGIARVVRVPDAARAASGHTAPPGAGAQVTRTAVPQTGAQYAPPTAQFAPPAEPAAPTPGTPAAAAGTDHTAAQFWSQVNALRGEVSSRLMAALAARELEVPAREALGQELIQQVVRDHNDALLSGGQRAWSPQFTARMCKALFDSLFRLGRLQPLIDTPGVENIEINGTQPALLIMGDGSQRYAEPIADTEAELIDFLQFIATRDPDNERSFTRANPYLNLDLPGRVRLAAVGWVVPWPRVTIRLQRLQAVTLAGLRELGTIDHVLEEFLGAAVRARKSIVVSGQGQGSGKTTLLRALCAALDPWESVATIETDYELYLHAEPDKHRRVVAMRTREGSGELAATGRRVGEVDTNQNVYASLRHNISRVIVGEARGPEIVSMFQAMQMGNGSLSTVHADGAHDVVERLVGMAVQDSTLSETYAYRQIAQSIDLIVFLRVDIDPDTGKRSRYVSEVIEVTRGEQGNPVAITDVFTPGEGGRAIPQHTPSFIEDLVRAGFNQTLLSYRGGLWGYGQTGASPQAGVSPNAAPSRQAGASPQAAPSRHTPWTGVSA